MTGYTKKKNWTLCILAALLMGGQTAMAGELWTAMCNDGQHVEYAQMRDGRGHITFNTPKPGSESLFNSFVAVDLIQTRYRNGKYICGTAPGNYKIIQTSQGPVEAPAVHFCMNRRLGTIYMVRRNPVTRDQQSGVFCSADVRVRTQ